jgi:2-keto-4-pentenoate hydratase/2-oxohepta-3-ene-1,7-dioic acid hydratase in catechol pathway
MKTLKLSGREYSPSKVLCVGQNYLKHVQEMGGKEPPKEPVVFLKPNSAIHTGGGDVFLPDSLGLVHHEIELTALIGRGGRNIPQEDATTSVAGYAVGLDLTLRDRQSADRKVGHPWDLAKGFDNAGVYGDFIPAEAIGDVSNRRLTLHLNGELRQDGSTAQMIHSIARQISFVSQFMTLEEGDLFMTGTPEGVGPLHHGDHIRAEIAGLPVLECIINRKGN